MRDRDPELSLPALPNAEWFELIWENVSEGLRLTDAFGRILAVNEAFCRMAGLSRQELVGQPMEIVYPESERARIRQRYRDLVEGRLKRPVVERMWRTAAGNTLWVEATIRRMELAGQTVVLTVFRDVTERRRLRQGLRQSQKRSALAAAEVALLLGHVSRLAVPPEAGEPPSSAFEQAFLKALAEIYSADRAVWYRYDWDRRICVRQAEWAAPGVESPSDAPVEFPLDLFGEWARRLLQGEWIEVADVESMTLTDLRAILRRRGIRSLLAVPVIEAGRCTGWLALHAVRFHRRFGEVAAREIQALAEAMAGVELLQRSRWQLEETRKRLEMALAESERLQRAAEQASEAKTRFLAMMSHEIRTPLNGVLGVLSLLETEPLPPAVRQHLALARESAEALLALLGDVLDLAKIESGVVVMKQQEFDVLDLLEQALAAVAPSAALKHLVLAALIEGRLPRQIRSDFGRLRQVLLNLLGNAVKFTQEGSVLLRAELAEEAGRPAVCFRVRDTGPGLEREEINRVFEPFYQGRHGRVTGTGAGLGLALSRRLIEHLGGRIGVRSEPGYGTEFYVVIPLDTRVERDEVVEPAPWRPLEGLRIGLAITDSLRREIISWQLAEWGATVMDDLACGSRLDALLADSDQVANGQNLEGQPTVACWRERSARLGLILPFGATREPSGHGTGVELFVEPLCWTQVLAWLGRQKDPVSEVCAEHWTQGPTARTDRCLHVLLADDNAINRRVVAALLKRLGCDVELASDGVEAMERLARKLPDLVLLDLEMPRMSGFELARQIRSGAMSGCPTRLPLLALSAHVLPEEMQRAFEAGVDGFLTKPVSLEQLQQALRSYLPPAGSAPLNR
jgi:PAS domain S-box-containing protein